MKEKAEEIERQAISYSHYAMAVKGFKDGAEWMQEQTKPKWIPIESEMPPKGFILFWYEGESHPVVWYNPGIKSETWVKNNKGSFWMPLPEKPEI